MLTSKQLKIIAEISEVEAKQLLTVFLFNIQQAMLPAEFRIVREEIISPQELVDIRSNIEVHLEILDSLGYEHITEHFKRVLQRWSTIGKPEKPEFPADRIN